MNWPKIMMNSRQLKIFSAFCLQDMFFFIKFATISKHKIMKLNIAIMKKTLVLFFALLLMSSNTSGKERTQSEMDSIAKSVHSAFTLRTRSLPGNTTCDYLTSDAVSSKVLNRQLRKVFPDVNKDYFVVYNYHEGKGGYAIISTDDRMPALIAFSDSQGFKTSEIPTAMQYMLAQYIKKLNTIEENPATTKSADINMEVAPLLGDIAFSQGSPYNDKCPLLNGERTATGCLATAMAQILAYYRYPTQMLGNKIEYITERNKIPVYWDCANTRFDWENILDTYSFASNTEYIANESTTDKQFLSFSNIKLSDENKLEISDLYNSSRETVTGDLQLLLFDNSGHFIQPIGQKHKITDLLPDYGWGSFFIEHFIQGDFEDGDYRLYLGLKLKETNEWSVIQRSVQKPQREEFYLKLKKNGMQYTVEGKTFACSHTRIQGEAIATLLAACGAATHMDYGTDGSSTGNGNVGYGLIDYMGYDDGLYFINSSLSPTRKWMEELAENELQQKRPIYCCGTTEQDGSHAFVIDGFRYMDGTPYFHVNWGWNGSDDGFFLLDAMTTNGGDNYGYKYILTFGIKPDDGLEDGVLFVIKKIDASVADGKITLTIDDFSNQTTKDFSGDVVIYAIDGQDKEYVLGEVHWDLWKAFNGYGTWEKKLNIPAGLPTGEYRIVMRTRESNSLFEKDILTPSSPIIKVENSTDINDATTTGQQAAEIYGLTGRKISTGNKSSEKLPKGVYIINGKKYIGK